MLNGPIKVWVKELVPGCHIFKYIWFMDGEIQLNVEGLNGVFSSLLKRFFGLWNHWVIIDNNLV